MTVTLQSTEQIVEVNGIAARVWAGHTASGIAVQALIANIAVPIEADHAEFEAELKEAHAPRPESMAFPLRMVI